MPSVISSGCPRAPVAAALLGPRRAATVPAISKRRTFARQAAGQQTPRKPALQHAVCNVQASSSLPSVDVDELLPSVVIPTAGQPQASTSAPAPATEQQRQAQGAHCNWPRSFDADYHLGSFLAQGSFGRVYEGVCRHTGQRVAVKVLSKLQGQDTHTQAEKLGREVRAINFAGVKCA